MRGCRGDVDRLSAAPAKRATRATADPWLRQPSQRPAQHDRSRVQAFIFLADTWNSRIRKIDPATGIITAFAGTGKKGYAGEGGPALKADFTGIYSLAFNNSETKLYLADLENRRIRVLDMKTRTVEFGRGQR